MNFSIKKLAVLLSVPLLILFAQTSVFGLIAPISNAIASNTKTYNSSYLHIKFAESAQVKAETEGLPKTNIMHYSFTHLFFQHSSSMNISNTTQYILQHHGSLPRMKQRRLRKV